MNPASVALQSQHLLAYGRFHLDTPGDRAEFADRLRNLTTTERTPGATDRSPATSGTQSATTTNDTTQAEPAAEEQTDQHAGENGAADQPSPEGQTRVSDSPIAVAAQARAKDRAGPSAGRPRDLRQRTDQEFFGHTDLAQLAAQELATKTPPVPTPIQSEPTPPAPPSRDAASAPARGAGSSPGAPEEAQPPAGQARVDSSAPEVRGPASQGAAGPTPAAATRDNAPAEATSPPGPAASGERLAPAAGSAAPSGATVAMASPVSAAASTAEASSGKPATEITGVGSVRTTGQLLKRLERGQSPLTLARHTPERADGHVPAAALRGLAAALRQGGGTVTLRLNPETLGSLKVQVSTQESGIIAKFQATTEQARRLLTENVDALRSAMESRGLSVDRIVIEHASGWMPPGSQEHHDARAGGAGPQEAEKTPSWNGGGGDPGMGADQDSGGERPGAGLGGQGRPEGREHAPSGAGAASGVAGAESLGSSTSGVITDDRDPEQVVMLRVDAVA